MTTLASKCTRPKSRRNSRQQDGCCWAKATTADAREATGGGRLVSRLTVVTARRDPVPTARAQARRHVSSRCHCSRPINPRHRLRDGPWRSRIPISARTNTASSNVKPLDAPKRAGRGRHDAFPRPVPPVTDPRASLDASRPSRWCAPGESRTTSRPLRLTIPIAFAAVQLRGFVQQGSSALSPRWTSRRSSWQCG